MCEHLVMTCCGCDIPWQAADGMCDCPGRRFLIYTANQPRRLHSLAQLQTFLDHPIHPITISSAPSRSPFVLPTILPSKPSGAPTSESPSNPHRTFHVCRPSIVPIFTHGKLTTHGNITRQPDRGSPIPCDTCFTHPQRGGREARRAASGTSGAHVPSAAGYVLDGGDPQRRRRRRSLGSGWESGVRRPSAARTTTSRKCAPGPRRIRPAPDDMLSSVLARSPRRRALLRVRGAQRFRGHLLR
jgi:hypothetical protein